MKKLKKISKKKKILIIVLILIVVFVAIRENKKNAQELLEANKIETEAIEKRNIAKSVSCTGIIKATSSSNIVSELTGNKIATINVVEGQKVEVGDIICTFDMSDTENKLSDAKSVASISNAQSNLSIESAQRALNEASKERDAQIVNAQHEVENARSSYEDSQNRLNGVSTQIASKQTELGNLTTKIAQIQQNDPTDNQLVIMQKQVETLTLEIENLQSTLSELQQITNTLKSAYDSAVFNLSTTTATQDSNVISMQDNVKNAELTAKGENITQNGELNTYEEQLKKATITSTVAGTVTSINFKAGDIYSGSTIATIDGIDNFIVEAEIDEYDIADIKEGMKALIKTDTTRDEELEGIVSYVAISPSTNISTETSTGVTSGNTTYKVQISLNEQNKRLRLGMNARISIILESGEDVWTVPFEAVQEREDSTKFIEVLKNNETEEKEEINVEIGIEGTYYLQIISDELKDGMEVVLPKQGETATSIEDIIESDGADIGV